MRRASAACTSAVSVADQLRKHADPHYARILAWFFKTGEGGYGQGDRFLGLRVPRVRDVARRCRTLPFDEVLKLLHSEFHEQRLAALVIWCLQFPRADAEERKRIYRAYLDNTRFINNWDLVDVSAEHIIGAYLDGRDRGILLRLAGSANLWERRIAMVSTFHPLRRGDVGPTLAIARRLLSDKHDLIHKAVGWLLREVGKRDRRRLDAFLDRHAAQMPRTMLRYAIERHSAEQRQAYLARVHHPARGNGRLIRASTARPRKPEAGRKRPARGITTGKAASN